VRAAPLTAIPARTGPATLPLFFRIVLGAFVVRGTWTILGLLVDMPICGLCNG
jgi:hypothetical protein